MVHLYINGVRCCQIFKTGTVHSFYILFFCFFLKLNPCRAAFSCSDSPPFLQQSEPLKSDPETWAWWSSMRFFYIDPSEVWRQASTSRELSSFLCNSPYKTNKRHQTNKIHKTNKIYPVIQKVYCAVNLDDMNIMLDNLWLFFFSFSFSNSFD